jgi:hypothetical protein
MVLLRSASARSIGVAHGASGKYGFLSQRVALPPGDHRQRQAVSHHEPGTAEGKGRPHAVKHAPDAFSLRLGCAWWPAKGTMLTEPGGILAEQPGFEGAVVEFVQPLIGCYRDFGALEDEFAGFGGAEELAGHAGPDFGYRDRCPRSSALLAASVIQGHGKARIAVDPVGRTQGCLPVAQQVSDHEQAISQVLPSTVITSIIRVIRGSAVST